MDRQDRAPGPGETGRKGVYMLVARLIQCQSITNVPKHSIWHSRISHFSTSHLTHFRFQVSCLKIFSSHIIVFVHCMQLTAFWRFVFRCISRVSCCFSGLLQLRLSQLFRSQGSSVFQLCSLRSTAFHASTL